MSTSFFDLSSVSEGRHQLEFTLSCLVEIFLGCLFGYVAASLSESYCHRTFGHTSASLRLWMRRYAHLFSWLKVVLFFHERIHHRRTYRKHFVMQFQDRNEQQTLLEALPPELKSKAQSTQFGLTIVPASFPFFLWLPQPVFSVR